MLGEMPRRGGRPVRKACARWCPLLADVGSLPGRLLPVHTLGSCQSQAPTEKASQNLGQDQPWAPT